MNETQINGAANVSASHCNVRMGGAGLPGVGNLDTDPLFVDEATGDLRLQVGSPCIDAGDPGDRGALADFEGDPRFLDGDLDGSVLVDMGADEFTPVRLSVSGTIAPGGTLTIDVTGPPGLNTILAVGPPGLFSGPWLL